jgi:hypothetical protein
MPGSVLAEEMLLRWPDRGSTPLILLRSSTDRERRPRCAEERRDAFEVARRRDSPRGTGAGPILQPWRGGMPSFSAALSEAWSSAMSVESGATVTLGVANGLLGRLDP